MAKNHPLGGAPFSIRFWYFKTISPQHPSPFWECCGLIFLYVDYCISNVHRSLFSFFVPTPKNVHDIWLTDNKYLILLTFSMILKRNVCNYHTSHSKKKMSQVLQVLNIVEILICHILEFFWLPKVTSTISKWPEEHDEFVIEGKRYSYNVW